MDFGSDPDCLPQYATLFYITWLVRVLILVFQHIMKSCGKSLTN